MIPDTILSLALLSRNSSRCPRCNCDLVRKAAFLRLGVPKQINYGVTVTAAEEAVHQVS